MYYPDIYVQKHKLKNNGKQNRRKDKRSLPVKFNDTLYTMQEPDRASSFPLLRGSLTVEAACILPLVLSSILLLLYFVDVAGLSGRIMAGLHTTGKELAVYAYVEKCLDKSKGVSSIIKGSLSAAYVKKKTTSRLEKEGVNTLLIKGGSKGIRFVKSAFLEGNDMIDIVVLYGWRFTVPFLPSQEKAVLQRARVRAWTGKSMKEDAGHGDNGQKEETVYVTTTGSVYHKNRECTHIRLSVRMVDGSSVEQLRNQDGGKYYPCGQCKGGAGAGVYITDTGDRYHGSVTCSGLKRGVLEVPFTQVEEWTACTRCGG